jgi:protein-arginine kinase activator protein McsA
MGVMACDRNGCENIMCDRLLELKVTQKYICNECFEELETYKNTWDEDTKVSDVYNRIENFMNSEPHSYDDCSDPEKVEQAWRNIIGGRS